MTRNDSICMRKCVHFEALEPRLLLDSAPLDWPLASGRDPAEWTVMVYLDADNNLEGAGIDDMNEMEVVGSTSSVNILVQFDRTSGHDTSNGNWTDTRRGRVVQDTNTSVINTPLTSIGEANMGAPATLSDFIQWGVTTYPANRYGVILWDHGGGTSGVCWDDTDSDHLTVAEVDQALTSAGVQMDVVGFDACLMGMMEQTYEIRNYADIMVASEQTEPWDGWSYDTFLADLVADPTQTATTLASSIVTRYGESYGGAETLSAVDVPGAQLLAGDLDTFAATVIAEDTDWGAISAARTSAAYFTDTNYRDLGTFIDGVVNYASNVNIITAAQAVQTTYASSIVSNHSGPGEGATGLSIYLPAQGGSVSSSYTAANFDLLADTQWDEFLVAFTGSSSTGTDLDGSITDANPAGTLPATISGFVGLDGAENVGGLDVDFYSLSVTTGQQIGFDIDAREMGGSLDSVLRLFDSIGLELDMNDDAYDPDTNQPSYDSYIEYTFTKTETVYIAVSGYSNWNYDPWTIGSGTAGSTGTYDLLIRNLGGPITDVNGTIPTATSLGSAPVLYSAVIGDEPIGDKDVDFYAIDVESNQGLTISVVSGGSGLDAYLKLFTGDGTLLASDDNTNGVDPEIDYDFSVPGAGMYYVAVSGVPNTNYDPFVLGSAVSGSTGSYALNVTGYSVHLDFDGVIPRANVIGAPPASVTGSIGDEPAGSLDVDFYAVDIAAGQTVGFDIDAEELGYALDSVLRLFNQYGTELASSDDGTDPDSGFVGSDPYIEYTFADGGTYYVAVSGAPNDVYSPFVEISGVSGDQGDYELHVRHVGAGSDLNGTIPTAVPVGSLPATMVGSIGDEAAGALDVDFYAVDALADQRLGFDIDAEDNGSPLDSMLRLFDNSGTELAMNDDATDPDTGISSYDSYLTYLFSADGTYFVAVSGYYNDMYDPFVEMSGTPGSTGDYELLIREIEPGPQDQVGPDGFGYIGYPVTPEFEDINGTGSAELTPYVDDNYFYLSATDLAGFEFDFYGTTYQDLYVSSNGLITFGSGNSDYTNTNLTTFPSQAAIAPYWDDLVVDSSSDAAVLWEVRGSGDQQRLIIQWNDIRYIAGAGEGQITFQAVLDETNDSMQFNYLDLASLSWHAEGASATVGIKDAGFQSVGEYVLQISIDEGPNAFVGTGLSTRVDLQGPTMPDLYGTIIAYPDPTPDGWYHIDWTVTNGGSGDAGGFWTDFYLSTNNIISTSDIFLGNIYLSGLAAGTQTGGTVGPNVLPNPGTWYVGMIIDSHDDVFESNETNNTAWDDITWLPAGPELDVEIRIVDSVYASDNMSDAEFASYTSIADVPVGATYYAEVWLRDTGSIMSGITGGQVDITYTTASADAGALDHGGVYTLLPSGAVDDPNGLIDDFGGATLNVGEGVTEWVRLGWADIAGTNVGDATFALLPGAANFAQVGAGNIDWSQINFTGTPVTVQQLPAGVDVDVWLVPRIAPSAANTSPTPPDSDRDPFWQRETCDYYVEVWIQSDQGNPAAISGGSVDVLFDPQYTEAISVDHGTIFTILPIENIDNVNGIVSIGGGTMATDMGDDEFVLLGRILFHGDAPVDEVAHQAGPYDTNLNVTNGPADFALVGTGNVDADFQAVPTVDIRANIYDIDDNGQVDFSDFSYFVPAFLHNVGDPEPPYVWWADFDESGQVNFGDFSYFATAFMKPFCDAGIVFPTGRFESTRLADLPESPLAIALSPAQASGAEAASVGAVQLPAAATRNFPALLEPEITRATPVNPAVMYTPNRLARQAGGDAWGTDAPVGAVIVPVLGMGDWMASLPNPKFQKEMEKTLPVQPVIGVSRLVIEKKSVRIGQPVAVPVLDVLQDIAALDTDL